MSIENTLADTFDIDLSEQQVEESTKRISEISADVRDQKYNLEDKEYIRAELQSLIELNRKVLETLSEQCKLGAPPRMYEVFSTLSNSISTNLMNLANLDKTVTDYQVKESDEEFRERANEQKVALINSKLKTGGSPGTLIQNNTYNFTSNEMLSMLKQIEQPKQITELENLPKFDLH